MNKERVIMRLDDSAWDEILEGLYLREQWFVDCGEVEDAKYVKELSKSLEQLGSPVLGGVLAGYQIRMTTGSKRQLEIRVVEDPKTDQ
jgi:hypothetical protein